jgi:hypothetical protein
MKTGLAVLFTVVVLLGSNAYDERSFARAQQRTPVRVTRI